MGALHSGSQYLRSRGELRNGKIADEGNISPSVKELGEDHILMASDCAHVDSEFPHTVAGIRARRDLTAKQKDKILGDNAVMRAILSARFTTPAATATAPSASRWLKPGG
jgi:hypothetical protein